MDSSEPIFGPNFDAEQPASDGCGFQSRLGAYHDGELEPAAAAAAVERHVASCESCRTELSEIRELSALAASVGAEGVSPFGMRRIHKAIDAEAEPRFSIFRIAGILTGVAASALIVGAAWLWEVPDRAAGGKTEIVIGAPSGSQSNWQVTILNTRPYSQASFDMGDQQMVAEAQFTNSMLEGLSGRNP